MKSYVNDLSATFPLMDQTFYISTGKGIKENPVKGPLNPLQEVSCRLGYRT
jgi:hypothetical protein